MCYVINKCNVQEWIEQSQLLARGKVNKFIHLRLIWDLIFGKANRTYALVDQTLSIFTSPARSVESFALATLILVHSIDHSVAKAQLLHLLWMFVQFLLCAAAQKMLKAFFVSTWLCLQACQERGSQLSTWICIIYAPLVFIQTSAPEPRNIEPYMYVIFSWFWFLLYFQSSQNFNQNIVLRRFCMTRN